MPRIAFRSVNGAAFTDIRPLTGWQYEYLPWPAVVKVLAGSTAAAGVATMAVNSGSEQIQRASPLHAPWTDGNLPTSFNNEPLIFHAPAGDRLEVVLAGSAAATIMGVVDVNPA